MLGDIALSPEQNCKIPILSLDGICKSFGPVRALEDITFDVFPGRVHGLVGENGAGKSTLVKIITGLEQADAGRVLLSGEAVRFHTPIEARAHGIVAVYQDPKLFPHLSVAENIALGAYPTLPFGVINRKRMYGTAKVLLERLGSEVDPQALVAGLSVAEHQFVEIARALSSDVKILILDEPTSALTPAEAERLFRVVRTLRDHGTAVILITHRLEEIEAMSDDISVIRDRRHVATKDAKSVDRASLVQMMVGRPLETLFTRRDQPTFGKEVLRVENLSLTGVFDNVSFSVRAGEVVGMGGLVGAGRSEIAQTLFGITPPTSGRVWLNDHEIHPHNPRQMLDLGLAYLPEDRDRDGLIMPETITHNITLPILRRLSHWCFVDRSQERVLAEDASKSYRALTPTVEQIVSALSGGNRQKVAFAKWLATNPVTLILDEPTHGIDIGSKAQVHEMVAQLASRGLAVLLISSDLPELLAMSDRILVIAEGTLVTEFLKNDATQEKVMMAAAQQTRRVRR
ncbi:sugar ABC transporter ATP-binding protein [Telmatospirillum sp.]|uniref:sugar ABC transporter ATP-binding protein n=1 Tax=Telmatospirillum sp. TaxID=2079197 RepID=UPI00284F9C4B|nr:sugar ABC transporter ATP-binding protein [Telmatospirillum sp.]MDR3440288.1 sugar ABC transporter ATP-binding protein [Telmatospirillum sp.]